MLTKTFRIGARDVGDDGGVKYSCLLTLFQELAGDDCAQYGASYEQLREKNLVFVAVRNQTTLFSPIIKSDVITVKTYSEKITRMSFFRVFEITKNNVQCGICFTEWALLDYKAHTLLRADSLFCLLEQKKKQGEFTLRKVITLPESGITVTTRIINRSDLDENRHVNNAVYADIITDALAVSQKSVSSLYIDYRNEAKHNDTLTVSTFKKDNGVAVILHNETSQKPCVTAFAEFYGE